MDQLRPLDREELLWALSIDESGSVRQGMALLREDAEETVLRLSTGDFLLLRSYHPDDLASTARLLERIETLRRTVQGPVTLAVIGGRPTIPTTPLLSHLSLFFVSAEGELLSGSWMSQASRNVRPILQVALRRLHTAGRHSLSEPQHTALVEAGQVLRHGTGDPEEAVFWARLRAIQPWATRILIGTIVFVFLLESLWGGSEFSPTLYRMGANVPDELRRGEFFRLCAAAFLHIGPVHLMANLWALYVFGDFLERVLGTARFLVVYTLSAVLGSLSSVLLGHAPLSAGASGAIWGLMVGGFALSFFGPVPEGLRSRIRARGWQPILLNLFISLAPGIDLYAHLGGGVAGGVLVFLASRSKREASREDPVVQGLGVACAVALLLSVGLAIETGRPWELVGSSLRWTETAIPKTAFTVELPETLGAFRADRSGVWIAGNLPKDPILVALQTRRTDARGAAALVDALQREPGENGMVPAEEARQVPGLPIATRRYSHRGGAALTVWLTEKDGVEVRVEVVALLGSDPSWRDAGERIAGSLKGRLGT